jgi:hypothetical protein
MRLKFSELGCPMFGIMFSVKVAGLQARVTASMEEVVVRIRDKRHPTIPTPETQLNTGGSVMLHDERYDASKLLITLSQ